jgi:very-short-patch-repair endonuclease
VTSFRAQKELLIDLLTAANLATGILVDTAHGFQGDERDVMLFSPVVAKGISPGTSRWVESPPNLINVALTRAREALFVVADFDYLKQQDGILRKLALYCDDISLLRETSPAELALFSLLVVDGWQPEVHPVIGDIEVDFLLERSGIRLVIEVDGEEYHKNKEEDKARDAFLRGRGYEVLRIPAGDVLATPHQVIHDINQVFKIDDTDDIQDDGTDGDPEDADENDDVDSLDN